MAKPKRHGCERFWSCPVGYLPTIRLVEYFPFWTANSFKSASIIGLNLFKKLHARQVIALDGKTLRHSYDRAQGKGAIHMVSAWASANHLVLGQMKVNEKSNEITALPKLIEMLNVKGCIVTIDAMGCQTDIARKIVEQEADYVLALKRNQGSLYSEVKDMFTRAEQTGYKDTLHDFERTVDGNHGRIEIRQYWTISDPSFIDYLNDKGKWAGMRSIGMVKAERRIEGQTSYQTRYYISSLSGEASVFGEAVRSHWGIENSVHWILDIAFREDDSRIRIGNAPENLAVLRHIALNLLKQEKTAKCGIKARRKKAGWDDDYLLKVLTG